MEELILKDEGDTASFAAELAPQLKPGDVVALYGELGAGKTFFARELCRCLGVREIVSSPSYVLLNEYIGIYPIAHLDLYRLENEEELLELGINDFLEECITLIEWPELAEDILPVNTVKIYFSFTDGYRKIKIERNG